MIHLDFETRSAIDIKSHGAHVYARHPSTMVICASWAIDELEPRLWFDPSLDVASPDDIAELLEAVKSGREIAAFNAEFERSIWNHAFVRQLRGHGIEAKPLEYEQMHCVAIQAYAMIPSTTTISTGSESSASTVGKTSGPSRRSISASRL